MSTHRRIYLDYNATAPLVDPARRAMTEAMVEATTDPGNPSSIHTEGRKARDRVERARAAVAALAGRPREQIVFTSGGSEANALGVLALAAHAERTGRPRVVATSPLEHPSLAGAVAELVRRGWSVEMLPVDGDGHIGTGSTDPIGLCAVAAVNHELGTTLDPGVLAWARGRGAVIHVDAVQAAGKLALASLDADALALSAHKLGGPQGTGAVAIGLDGGLPVVAAGHQERGRRGGTENAIGIAGFGAAAAAVDVAAWPAIAELGAQLERGLARIDGVRIHGAGAPRTGGTVNAGFAGAYGDAIVIALDLAGIAVSTGAACTSGSIEPSPVLLGLGQTPAQAREAVRFSLGPGTTTAEIEQVLERLPAIVSRARQHR
jgi:cysteine desulfurase